ncbi:MAG: hypothetical protein AAGJ46_02860 [Planctomycetota bacterium]
MRMTLATALVLLALASPGVAEDMNSKLQDALSPSLEGLPTDTTVGVVLLDGRGDVLFSQNAELELSAASSIKSSLLLEFFAKHASELRATGRRDVRAIVEDPRHPAIVHFDQATQQEIAGQLGDASVLRLGYILIDSNDETGAEYSNKVYNAAANVAIALLGGPAGSTRAIHERDASFAGANLRRYMLADRNVTGDNTATPMMLARFFQIALGEGHAGVDPAVAQAVADVLHRGDEPSGLKHFSKTGALYTDPVTSVRSGRYERGGRVMNYAIMATQKLGSPTSGAEQYKKLSEMTRGMLEDTKRAWSAASEAP